jgi:hypothetical protein
VLCATISVSSESSCTVADPSSLGHGEWNCYGNECNVACRCFCTTIESLTLGSLKASLHGPVTESKRRNTKARVYCHFQRGQDCLRRRERGRIQHRHCSGWIAAQPQGRRRELRWRRSPTFRLQLHHLHPHVSGAAFAIQKRHDPGPPAF